MKEKQPVKGETCRGKGDSFAEEFSCHVPWGGEKWSGEKVGGEQCEEALGYHGDGYSVKTCILQISKWEVDIKLLPARNWLCAG